jgi:CxxC-x17-CxxC domain-containing protein
MGFENIKLRCIQCGSDFEFTANEQAFFAERGLSTPPKRCKACRKAHKSQSQRHNQGSGIYRSPAFGQSAPNEDQGRGHRKGPQFRGKGRLQDYRSPAFRDLDRRNFEEEYRSPAFRDIDRVKPEDEYRSPGFREYEGLDVRGEYRSPGFQDPRDQKYDERPMFQIICAGCEQKAMVPFLPEEKEGPHYCQECYAKERKRQAELRAAEEKETAPAALPLAED